MRPSDPLSRQGLERELGRRYGAVFSKTRAGTLDNAFERAADEVGARTLADLLGRALVGDAAALRALVRETSVGETYFFREEEGLTRLVDVIRRASAPVIAWSAGCASGEEAYSLVVLAMEAFGPAVPLRVIATDVNAAALDRAREALYAPWSFRNVSPERMDRWFDRVRSDDGSERLRPIEAVRARVEIRLLNLAADDAADNRWPVGCDLVLCRNVLVYFAPAAARLVAWRFAGALAAGGELVTAATDPPVDSAALRVSMHVPPVYVRAEQLPRPKVMTPRLSKLPARPTPIPRASSSRARLTPRPSRGPAALCLPAPPVAANGLSPVSPPIASAAATPALEQRLAEARALADAGAHAAAMTLLDELVAAHPLAVGPRVLRAFVYMSTRRPAEARTDAEAALLLDATVPMAHVVAAMAAADLGDGARARRSARNALGALAAQGNGDPPALSAEERAEMVQTCRALLAGRAIVARPSSRRGTT